MFGANAKDIGALEVGFIAERSEDGVFLVEKVENGVKLGDLALIHDENTVVVRCGSFFKKGSINSGDKTYRWCSDGGQYRGE